MIPTTFHEYLCLNPWSNAAYQAMDVPQRINLETLWEDLYGNESKRAKTNQEILKMEASLKELRESQKLPVPMMSI